MAWLGNFLRLKSRCWLDWVLAQRLRGKRSDSRLLLAVSRIKFLAIVELKSFIVLLVGYQMGTSFSFLNLMWCSPSSSQQQHTECRSSFKFLPVSSSASRGKLSALKGSYSYVRHNCIISLHNLNCVCKALRRGSHISVWISCRSYVYTRGQGSWRIILETFLPSITFLGLPRQNPPGT